MAPRAHLPRILIIGAGIGGLAAAARLAHSGHRVEIFEAGASPGGKMRSLPTAAGLAEAGPTVLTLRAVFDDLFADCNARLEDRVSIVPEPLLARHFWPDGTQLDLFSDHEESAAAIRTFAGPRAESQFHAFAGRAAKLFAAFDAPMMQAGRPNPLTLARRVMAEPGLLPAIAPHRSLSGLLARNFDDPRLRQLFGRYATYVGGTPDTTPALLSLVWQAEAAGIWRVTGGLSALARAVADLAVERGATLYLDTSVKEIRITDGAVRGVVTGNDRLHAGEIVLHAGDPRALGAGHLGVAARKAVSSRGTDPRSLSAEVWAFAAKPDGPPLAHHNVFFGADPKTEFDPIRHGRPPDDPTVYVCAQDRGTNLKPPRIERFETIVNAPPGLAEQEYETCRRRTFGTLARRGLTFSPEPSRSDGALTDPQGFGCLFPGSMGALYGRAPTGLMAAFARPRATTRIKGLYLAGGGTHPGPGVPMAGLSGKHAAAAIATARSSTSMFRRRATPGGTSTGSATTVAMPSTSSDS
ncbi:1-hydroxycarotenoid 3,4-desaturase CrtD [Palleronia aestuarii]|nr:1-hydroxycarotenoid 3,4-desaturase CrtD [Palleronia aestuarii]